MKLRGDVKGGPRKSFLVLFVCWVGWLVGLWFDKTRFLCITLAVLELAL